MASRVCCITMLHSGPSFRDPALQLMHPNRSQITLWSGTEKQHSYGTGTDTVNPAPYLPFHVRQRASQYYSSFHVQYSRTVNPTTTFLIVRRYTRHWQDRSATQLRQLCCCSQLPYPLIAFQCSIFVCHILFGSCTVACRVQFFSIAKAL